MGQGKSQFSEEELQDYQDLTYFTKKEVLYAHQKFKALAPEKVGHNKNAKLPMSKILQYPELSVNPFGERICRIFSSSQDGDCTFEDFLDIMSVFSQVAPKSVKAEHAFRIFDFDGDDMLGASDLKQVINKLTGENKLSESEMNWLIQNILEEADLDDDGALSFAEFEHIIDRSSDFLRYGEYPELSDHLHKYIKKQDDVLITGCGNSTLGQDLYDIGYSKITNIDISNVVIRQMLSKRGKARTNLKYLQMDALNMTVKNEEFSVVLDKGTLDALMPDGSEETTSKINQYFSEVQRVLKTGGRYICISLLQEHILRAILNYFPSNNWIVRIIRCFEAEKKAIENGESSMPIFIVVCTKVTVLTRKVLELNLGSLDKMQRFEREEDVILHISSVQHAAFVCSGLKRSSIENENEVVLDLYQPGGTTPRFTVYVVDVSPQHRHSQYAAFIVPQGREVEWLFSTKLGRKHLVKITKHNRLAIITLHRGQKFNSLDTVQEELTDTVRNLAPSSLTNKKILFLSLGTDVGHRVTKYEGHSACSGDYIVEDVETDNGEKFRRLFYMNSQLVIQSEAKLKTIKSRKGVAKEVVDLTCLTCKHHVYMSIAAHAACRGKKNSTVAVIGLGGGGLCSFLHKFLPKSNFIGIDIDKDMLQIATDWFGFHQDDKLTVKIQDGLEYLRETSEKGEKLDAVLFDIDSKDTSVGMSCPPKIFLEKEALSNIVSLLGDAGLFVLNVVLRDDSLRPAILKNLKSYFQTVLSYKLEEDLNEIIICANSKVCMDNLREACTQINNFFKRNNLKNNEIEIDRFMESLVQHQ